jgi:hypothetical protein
MSFRQGTTSKLIKRLALMIFLLLMGLSGGGWALAQDIPLQVEGDRLTGHLSQVPLRTVLEQLQKQLGIAYEAPAGELDKVISVDLQQDPILPALAKILAAWDYAFTMNAAGRLQFLYVTPKAPPAEAVSETSESSNVMPSNALVETESSPITRSRTEREVGDADSSLSQERESDPILPPSSSAFASPPREFSGLRAPVAGGPMAIQPVPAGTRMPMVPPSGVNSMQISPPANPPNMPIIPATSYPPMDIQPVPDYLKEEMLRNIQP